jgi:formylmethanofuran dehydrogenase subunit D
VHIIINIYRCIKKSAGMMLTKEIEHYRQQWNYIKIRQAKNKTIKCQEGKHCGHFVV